MGFIVDGGSPVLNLFQNDVECFPLDRVSMQFIIFDVYFILK